MAMKSALPRSGLVHRPIPEIIEQIYSMDGLYKAAIQDFHELLLKTIYNLDFYMYCYR